MLYIGKGDKTLKRYLFKVEFEDGSVRVYAFNAREAMILAQAHRINSGMNYEVTGVEKLDV